MPDKTIYVLPSNCPLLEDAEDNQDLTAHLNSFTPQEHIHAQYSAIFPWEYKSQSFLPDSLPDKYNWVCAGCSVKCTVRRCKIGGNATDN